MSLARWFLLVIVLLAASLLSVALGTVSIPISALWDALRHVGQTIPIMVVWTLRIPRVTLAILVGAGLGMSGAALQGTMRNPLAEPYLLGVSGGAAVGAVMGTMLGLGVALLPVAAFSGSIVAMLAAFFVARTAGSGSTSIARRSECFSLPRSSLRRRSRRPVSSDSSVSLFRISCAPPVCGGTGSSSLVAHSRAQRSSCWPTSLAAHCDRRLNCRS